MLDQITPIIATFNEAPNIQRTLSALKWAKEVLIIDSYSDDDTIELCSKFDNVRIIYNQYDGPTAQSNFGLAQDIQTQWVMSMDADYVVPTALKTEIAKLTPNDDVHGFEISFEYLINGHPLKGSLYPPRTLLYRHRSAHYIQDGHTQRVVVDGLVLSLQNKMQHDDRKPYSRWLASQRKYAHQEAKKLAETQWKNLSWADRLRYCGIAPLAIIPYTLFIKGLIFNGPSGLEYTWQRLIAECCLQSARLKLKLNKIAKK